MAINYNYHLPGLLCCIFGTNINNEFPAVLHRELLLLHYTIITASKYCKQLPVSYTVVLYLK